MANSNRPHIISDAGIKTLYSTVAIDEEGSQRELALIGERPLTIYFDKQEIVTLMTMGSQPELLTLGYLYNQGFIQTLDQLVAIQVDWDVAAVAVTTIQQPADRDKLLAKRTITSGCGQGTMFGDMLSSLDNVVLHCPNFTAELIYRVLNALAEYNQIYKQAGAVHGCALVSRLGEVDIFVEDVGRHNAVDAISGWMLLHNVSGVDKVFYTTGRLTSEMVIKVAQMRVPLLLSRSGITEMGLSIAKKMGIALIARAKGHHFLVFSGFAHYQK